MNCGPLCLVHNHRSHGQRLSLRRARQLAKTSRDGTYATGMMDALRTLGYTNVRLRRQMDWNVLKYIVQGGSDVFVTWWSPLDSGGVPAMADGHWSIAKEVTKDTITLYDPDEDGEITLPRKMFESFWYDYERDHAGKRDDFIRSAVIARYKSHK